MTKRKAIVLGVNYYIGLSAIRSLGKEGIPVIAMDYDPLSYGFGSKYVSEQVLIPDINKEGENKVVEFLKNFGKKFSEKPVLLPAADPYAIMISNSVDELEDYYLFPPLPKGLVSDLVNKHKLYKLAQKHGMPIPKTFFVQGIEDLENIKNEMVYPCIVKPELSHEFVKKFRKKVFEVSNYRQLYEAVSSATDADLDVMIQEIIPGPDDHVYTYDAYFNRNAEPVKVFTNRKQRQFPIHFGASVFTESVFEPRIIQLGEDFLKKIGYHGIVEIELKKDPRNGKFYMIEINPRVTNFNNVILTSGINLPAAQYYDMIGESLSQQINREEGLKFVYFYEDVKAAFNYMSSGELSFFRWIKSYIGPLSYAIFDLQDLKPLILFIKKLIKRFFKKITGARTKGV
ncbi:ATP-grasp domain-containing protein [Natranaerobius thermophilus]|uniref:ATP-grasp protein-like protein n=1 Tax=Natranaerobius thermophilus (strain ATCC BAA-1301 / DSM 18059 / JW/NM-WN-LF) TaxID=457570 RepID=B2A3J9_NATTJ|nr:ATP-grasp domain-containing protein [Natranaerobius thermophilus]ACB86428.1 ATP-grasp protein-like protein [Natranaerobius thermophilus JW/NM-WN-LF]